jgi:hypothetical protein
VRRKRVRRAAALPIAALAISFGFGGCGSSGEQADATLTKAQFRKQADVICNKASNDQAELGSKYLIAHPNATEADLIEPAVLPPLEAQLRKLRDLPAPSGYEAQIQSFLKALEEALEGAKENPQSLLAKSGSPFDRPNQLGEKYQLGDCGRNP